MNKNLIKVKDLNHLNQLIEDEKYHFFVNGLRISIFINHVEQGRTTYSIVNWLEDTEQFLTQEELFDKELSDIGYALNHGALYNYGD